MTSTLFMGQENLLYIFTMESKFVMNGLTIVNNSLIEAKTDNSLYFIYLLMIKQTQKVKFV